MLHFWNKILSIYRGHIFSLEEQSFVWNHMGVISSAGVTTQNKLQSVCKADSYLHMKKWNAYKIYKEYARSCEPVDDNSIHAGRNNQSLENALIENLHFKRKSEKTPISLQSSFPTPPGPSSFFSFRYYRFRSFFLNGFAKGIILYEGRIGWKDKKYYEIAKRGAARRTWMWCWDDILCKSIEDAPEIVPTVDFIW